MVVWYHKDMKKKKCFRFLSLIFAFLFVFAFAGCSFDKDSDGEEGGMPKTQSIAGAKVLYRPADYNFSAAVEATENYYNTLSKWILDYLYRTFMNQSYTFDEKEQICVNLDVENEQKTFSNVPDANKYYLYDSMRYTIKSFATEIDGGEQKKIIKLNFGTAWNWSLSPDLSGQDIVFYKYADIAAEEVEYDDSNGLKLVKFSGDDIMASIKDYYDASAPAPAYPEYYYSTDNTHFGDEVKDTFFLSPYYNGAYEVGATGVKNYFQDALEYAIYMFVLGYTMENDADVFTFNVNHNTGAVTVGSGNKSIVTALGEAKARYKETGNYVGLAEKDILNIKRFVLTKIIGIQSPNTYVVNIEGVNTTFNRNYDKIVSNIVDYACQKAPIGKDENGGDLYISSNYLASCVTEFSADQFFLNYTIPEGEEGAGTHDNDNEYLFYYIPAAEYQSVVIYPLAEQITTDPESPKLLQDIWLAFEYYDNPTDKEMLDSITINVGFRYFSCVGDGTFVVDRQASITLQRGKNTTGALGDSTIYIGYDEKEASQYQILLPSNLTINTGFNNVDAINPEKNPNAQQDGAGNYYSTLVGGSTIKDYYKLNNSSSYGQFGTLNPSKFSQSGAGEDACDYMEIYFDIEKDKTATNVSYNFKVALGVFYAYSLAEQNKGE